MADDIADTWRRLRQAISQVTADEFYRHDSHYNRDSRLGRELLYLIANDDWIRSTTEVINLGRSDAIDTTVAVNVDLGKITHEAFSGAGPIWLPLLVLPAARGAAGGDAAQPPPGSGPQSQDTSAGQLIVTDPDGSRLAPLPDADVWHAISAALAEIIVTIADAVWPWPDKPHPGADRNQRLVLSAALFRVLSGSGHGQAHGGTGSGDRASALGTAQADLEATLGEYFASHLAPRAIPPGNGADPSGIARVQVERATGIIQAFAQAIVVVVGMDRVQMPTVLSVTAPTRKLAEERRSRWRVFRALQPRARLVIDLLLPSADADRQVEITVPDGLSFDAPAAGQPGDVPGNWADLVVKVGQPPAAGRLATLVRSVLAKPGPEQAIRQCLIDLAMAQADTLAEVLDQHYVLAVEEREDGPTYDDLAVNTRRASQWLTGLRRELRRLAASPPGAPDGLDALETALGNGHWLNRTLQRRASVSVPSPDTMTGRVGLLENTRQRVPPRSARVTVPVEVADAQFFSIARFSGGVSMLLMLVVGCFFAFALLHHRHEDSFSPEVIASALTLFSVIQAGRVEAPDRSMLRGKLTGAGNLLIIASILPTVLLAVALAFDISGWAPVLWALFAIAIQGVFLLTMWRGPLSAAAGHRHPPARVLRTSSAPDYGKLGLLHADWWQTATASALVLGGRAHAYLILEPNGGGAATPPHPPQPHPPPPRAALPGNGRPQPGSRRNNAGSMPAAQAGAGPSLPGLLGRLQPRLAAALNVTRSAASQRGEQAGAQQQKAAAHPAQEAGSGPPSTADPAPNILAMLRSGTANEALTFVVMREQPTAVHDRLPEELVSINPDRLAPYEAATTHVDIIVGVPRNAGFPLITSHPLFAVLGVVKTHYLPVVEVQLPVTPPDARPSAHVWARVRVGIRSAEYARIAGFLAEIGQLDCPLWVRASPEHIPRRLRACEPGHEEAQPVPTDATLLTARDLDAVSAAVERGADPEAPQWRMLAITANAGVTVAHEVLAAIGGELPGLGLASLTYAHLHGMAVCLLLGKDEPGAREAGHGAQGDPARDELARVELEGKFARLSQPPGLRLQLDERRTASQLGFAAPHPLVQVNVRTRDMPGTLQIVIDALHQALRAQLQSLPATGTSDWHAVLETGVGHTAEAQMTLRLPVATSAIAGWKPEHWADIARDARYRTVEAAMAASPDAESSGGRASERYDVPEDIVITLRPISWAEPLPAVSAVAGAEPVGALPEGGRLNGGRPTPRPGDRRS